MDCPDRPRDRDHLPFKPRRMVRWLSPAGLVSTGFQVALAGIFGLYIDKREIQAALAAREVSDYSGRDGIWVDYVADTGDGFAPTYTIARLLGAQKLSLKYEGVEHETNGAGLLVLGGDLAYPVADEVTYHDRLLGPLEAALPCTPETEPRTLFAVPGNHDWYDGLTTFLRLFCRGRWVGGWRTKQTRSYFAVKLPGKWWLWGIDIQFDFHIDEPQVGYFQSVAREVEPDDHVILCTAKPSWVRERLPGDGLYGDPRARRNLEYFERRVLAPRGVSPVLTLAGDLHHYSRYESTTQDAPRQHKITAGGGGAFLYPTHTLPSEVHWPRRGSDGVAMEERHVRAAEFPDAGTSRRLRWGALWAPFMNPSFLLMLGGVYLMFGWALQFSLGGSSIAGALADASFAGLTVALLRSPSALLLAAVVLVGLVAFADVPNRAARLALGVVHGLVHIGLVLAGAYALGRVASDLNAVGFAAAFVGILGVGGGIAAGLVMGAYLTIVHVLFGRHATEAFSAQHIADYKSFVRMHVAADGVLTIYPVGIERVPRAWDLRPDAPADAPWFEPADEPITAHLIERPVEIRPR